MNAFELISYCAGKSMNDMFFEKSKKS